MTADYALVLNAGSSSLKFCVFRRPENLQWLSEAKGQIEGIGTSPRLSVKDGSGALIADEKLDIAVKDGHKAVEALAAWLRSRYGGGKVLGVGHRVVHGGSRFVSPTIVTREILAQLNESGSSCPVASTIQSGGHRRSF